MSQHKPFPFKGSKGWGLKGFIRQEREMNISRCCFVFVGKVKDIYTVFKKLDRNKKRKNQNCRSIKQKISKSVIKKSNKRYCAITCAEHKKFSTTPTSVCFRLMSLGRWEENKQLNLTTKTFTIHKDIFPTQLFSNIYLILYNVFVKLWCVWGSYD